MINPLQLFSLRAFLAISELILTKILILREGNGMFLGMHIILLHKKFYFFAMKLDFEEFDLRVGV